MATRWLVFLGVLTVIIGLFLRYLLGPLVLYGLLAVGAVLIVVGAIPES